jgi:DNA-binding response OmpR family regulator
LLRERVTGMLAESHTSPPLKEIQFVENLEIRPAELQVLVEGERAGLTVREFELFSILVRRIGKPPANSA